MMRFRPTFAVAASIVIITLGVAIAGAGNDKGTHASSDRQSFKWRDEPTTTSSQDFTPIPGLRMAVCNRGGMTVEVSGDVKGGDVDFRAFKGPGEGRALPPGAAHYDASTDHTSFAFTWAHASGARNHRTFEIRWRSPSGAEVTLNHALMRVIYDAPNKLCL